MTIGLTIDDHRRTQELRKGGVKIIEIYRLGLDAAEAREKKEKS